MALPANQKPMAVILAQKPREFMKNQDNKIKTNTPRTDDLLSKQTEKMLNAKMHEFSCLIEKHLDEMSDLAREIETINSKMKQNVLLAEENERLREALESIAACHKNLESRSILSRVECEHFDMIRIAREALKK